MTRSTRNKICIALNTILTAQILLLSSCTNKDPLFANGMIPPSQQMTTTIDSTISLRTFNIAVDSMQTNNSVRTFLLGQHTEPLVGQLTATGVSNYFPEGFPDETLFGKDARVDSMTISFTLEYFKGDTMQNSKVEIYRVVGKNFLVDSPYYSNLDMTPYLSEEPLVSFETKSGGLYVKHLPLAYAKEHLDNVAGIQNIYYEDTTFHKRFNGLYFKIAPLNPGPGAMFTMSTESARLFLYYNNKSFPDKPDTVLTQTMFLTAPYGTPFADLGTRLPLYKNDYSKANTAVGGIDYRTLNDTINPSQRVYISGPVGLGTLLKISREDVANFLRKIHDKGFSTVGLHKAELIWEKEDKTWQNYDKSMQSLGAYYSMSKPDFISDYNPLLEELNTGYKSTLGGMLNRSKGQYSMDITRYMQGVLTRGNQRYDLQIMPDYMNKAAYIYTVLWGSQATMPKAQPKLVLTYTMIK